jgi:hypothetical protein
MRTNLAIMMVVLASSIASADPPGLAAKDELLHQSLMRTGYTGKGLAAIDKALLADGFHVAKLTRTKDAKGNVGLVIDYASKVAETHCPPGAPCAQQKPDLYRLTATCTGNWQPTEAGDTCNLASLSLEHVL